VRHSYIFMMFNVYGCDRPMLSVLVLSGLEHEVRTINRPINVKKMAEFRFLFYVILILF